MATATDKADKLAAAHSELVAAVESLASSEDWQKMLEVAARFHHYSPNNVLMILRQNPEATRVAGYKTWQSLGRQVRKGERGLVILAPCGGPCKACAGTGHHPTDHSLTCGRCQGRGRWANFTTAHVWDIAQTDGDDLPDIRPELLSGDVPVELWDSLATQVKAAGFDLERGDCGPANGQTDFLLKTVRVRDDVSGAQACKTLAHELAHVILHNGTEYGAGCRGRAEVEAESVAYLVCKAAGLDSDGYSFTYVASWSGGDAAKVSETAARVMTAARGILAEMGTESEAEVAA